MTRAFSSTAMGTSLKAQGESVCRQGWRAQTNDESASILLGITRDAVIRIARDLGKTVEIGPLRRERIMTADEAFFTEPPRKSRRSER
jgi:hypothetical protein